MRRRGAGVGLILLLAAALMMSLPVLLRPTQLDGVATAAPMPEPPLIGDCLKLDTTRVLVVPCSEPHYSQVTARWIADDPERWNVSTDQECTEPGNTFLDFNAAPQTDWSIPIRVSMAKVEAPPSERIRTRGWTICTVAAGSGGVYSGSLRSITPTERPSATSSCFFEAGDSSYDMPCHQPHGGERLAFTWQTVADPGGVATPLTANGSTDFRPTVEWPPEILSEITSGCETLARTLLDTEDPTAGGLLKLSIRPGLFAAAEDHPAMAIATADCEIRPVGDRLLNNTVIGHGDGAVPFA